MRAGVILRLAAAMVVTVSPLVNGQDDLKEAGPSEFPTMTVKNGGRQEKLELRSMTMAVEVRGLIAETVFELEFFNHTGRRQEGEFVMKLPEKATVSTYALDIQGNMRPGVSVEKEQARHAYETIKRRQIDPGLVEREAGNVYRTRIFPIEPNSPKRVRIGYIRPLETDGVFSLPLKAELPVQFFRCSVQGGNAPVMEGNLLSKKKPNVIGVNQWQWEAANFIPKGNLSVQSELPEEKPSVLIRNQPDGSAHFVVQGKISEKEKNALDPKANWKRVRLVWDASFSGRFRDHEREIGALEKIWKWVGDTEVEVLTVGYGGESEPASFSVKAGDGSAISAFLKKQTYDGAADFSRVELKPGVTTLVVTDGSVGAPLWHLAAPAESTPVIMMTNGARPDVGLMNAASGWLNLADDESWWKEVTNPGVAVGLRGMPNEDWDVNRNGQFYAVTGYLPKNYHASVTVEIAGKEQLKFNRKTGEVSGRDSWNLARRVWAQRRLQELEQSGNRQMITVFAKQERLVSDYTSLIVLERFQDHVEFRIPPPEPDLHAEYLKAIETREQEVKFTAVRDWQDKIAWHEFKFPWMDEGIQREIVNVSIWVKSSRKVFPARQQNREMLEKFDGWLDEAVKLTNAKHDLKSRKEFKDWSGKLGPHLMKLEAIRSAPIPKPKDGKVHVSVRGFVRKRSVQTGGPRFDLQEAIRRAGGPAPYGTLSKVYLYRNAQRTGFNLHNRDVGSILLEWGDMIVVEERERSHFFTGDPFSAPADPFADPVSAGGGGSGPAVFEEPGSMPVAEAPLSPRRSSPPSGGGADPFGGGEMGDDPFGTGRTNNPNRLASQQMRGRIVTAKNLPNAAGVADLEILKGLRSAADPIVHYQKLLEGEFGENMISLATVIEVARIFFERNLDGEGEVVLSNLSELQSNPIEGIRSLAFWLADLGRKDRAIQILESTASEIFNDPGTVALLYQDAGQIADNAALFRKAVAAELDLAQPSPLCTIALTDFFGRGGKADDELASFSENPMPSDIRLVVSVAGDHVDMRVFSTDVPDLPKYGARQRSHARVHEFQFRQALPGDYRVVLSRAPFPNDPPVTVRATFYVYWADGQSTKTITKTITRLMDGSKLELSGMEFNW